MGKGTSSNPLIDQYFKEVARHPLPTAKEEFANFTAYRAARVAAQLAAGVADREAKAQEVAKAAHKIAHGYLRFVVDTASKRTRSPELLLELIGEGNIGLMHAITKFEPERGNRFLTYAANWVKVKIAEHLHKLRPVNVPSHTRKETKKRGEPVADLSFACVDNVVLVAPDDVATDVISRSFDAMALLGQAHLTRIEKLVLIYTYGLRGGEPLTPERVGLMIYCLDGTQFTSTRYEAAHSAALHKLRTHLSDEQVHALMDVLVE